MNDTTALLAAVAKARPLSRVWVSADSLRDILAELDRLREIAAQKSKDDAETIRSTQVLCGRIGRANIEIARLNAALANALEAAAQAVEAEEEPDRPVPELSIAKLISVNAFARATFHYTKRDIAARIRALKPEAGAKPALFVEGEFVAHSGDTLFEKIECDALTYDDWHCLAEMVARRVDHRPWAIGIPEGGLALARALNALPFSSDSASHRNLVVDDVLTTGNSMREALAQHPGSTGFVVFDRSGGKNLPPNCRALFTLDARPSAATA